MLIKIENGKPVGGPINNESFCRLFPETSFPAVLTPEDVESFGYGIYTLTPQPLLGMHEKVVEITPVKDSKGVWLQTWEIVPMSEQEIDEKNAALKAANKAQAAQLLAESDWSDKPSVTDITKPLHLINAAEWDAYRDALRAIAVVTPVEVSEWPVKPEEIWSAQ